MEILFDAQLPTAAEPPAFSLTFEPEHMALQSIADMAAIRVQAQMKRESAFWNRPQFRDLYPLLFPLHGILYGSPTFPGNQGIAASLVPMENFPLAFPDENSQLLNLSFHCSRAYLQYIEEQRASNPRCPSHSRRLFLDGHEFVSHRPHDEWKHTLCAIAPPRQAAVCQEPSGRV